MEPIATGAAADPEAPPHTMRSTKIDESASSSQGPRNQDNAPIYNWPILDLLPSKNNGNEGQDYRKCEYLYEAALNGDWVKARHLIDRDPLMLRTAITEGYETALHVATKAQQTDFVLQIMELMSEQDLTLQDVKGDTAFFLAVATGNRQLVEAMRSRNPDLATLRGSWNMTPLYLAVSLGNSDMAMFLYHPTLDLTAEDRARIFFQSIKTDLYDLAFRLLRDANELAKTRDTDDDTALHVLAQKPPSTFEPPSRAIELVRCLWQEAKKYQESVIKELIRYPSNLLFDATRKGNVIFLAYLIDAHPDLVLELDEKKRTIFHIAILHRRISVFNLIHKLDSVFKKLIATYVDVEKNTLLHLAAKNPNQSPALRTALKMQQELLLFKEVEKIIPVSLREATNAEDLTARELFTIEHGNLVKSGLEWLRNSAGSYVLVATLIATVVFAAAFTAPGGQDDKTGMPLLQKNIWFCVFAISDSIALTFSLLSMVILVSILTPPYRGRETDWYREAEFLMFGTFKMIFALLSLFISLAAMSIAFSSTFILVYHDGSNIIPFFTLMVVTWPIIVFVLLQYPHLIDMFRLHFPYLKYKFYLPFCCSSNRSIGIRLHGRVG